MLEPLLCALDKKRIVLASASPRRKERYSTCWASVTTSWLLTSRRISTKVHLLVRPSIACERLKAKQEMSPEYFKRKMSQLIW
ncbi:hypothetical protein MTO96_022315 [Rhipicephalus appendiculatus]